MIRAALAAAALSVAFWAAPVQADIARLSQAIGLPEVVAIMADEGRAGAGGMVEESFGGRGAATWPGIVAGIYDAEAMRARVEDEMDGLIGAPAREAAIAFFEGEVGRRIVRMEIAARAAIADPEIEAVAEDIAAEARSADAPVAAQVAEFVEVNDLLDQNVEGGLRSSFEFTKGLVDGGALPPSTTDETIMADVWAGLGQKREETATWLGAYLTMLFSSLEADDVDAYIAFSRTDAGQELNAAIMGGFDVLFADMSRRLGTEAATFLTAQDL
ncbi:MAG: hypothetical protein ACU0CO_16590 [Shimia sp.]